MARPSRYAPDTLPRPYHWGDDAACRGEDLDVFFPVSSNDGRVSVEELDAKAVCSRCPVRIECLRHALTRREEHGVWGGLSESERAKMIREARLDAERRRRRERKARQAEVADVA